jgi:hypothetical protein
MSRKAQQKGMMLQPYRDDFNRRFTEARYQNLLARMAERTGERIPFRVAETPVFVSAELMQQMIAAGHELTLELLDNPEYMARAEASVPPMWRSTRPLQHPNFMTVDFGIVRAADGSLEPKLVELQAFPSIYGYQSDLIEQYRESFDLGDRLDGLLGGHDRASYWRLLRQVIVGEHDPENVVLTEIEPEQQKTRPDFRVYERELGIRTIDIRDVRVRGRQLFYQNDGREVPIRRIFNRAIADELDRKEITLPFDLRDDLEVEWAGHPSWFFRISKLSLPYLHHPTVPKAVFLDDWFDDSDSAYGNPRQTSGLRTMAVRLRTRAVSLPIDRERLLLKPLFSFAGKGIQFAPADKELQAIPKIERTNYLLQERLSFEPVVATPYGPTQAEIRILYLWPDGGSLEAVASLVRLGRGLMMGVDQNRDQRWVGGSAAFSPVS